MVSLINVLTFMTLKNCDCLGPGIARFISCGIVLPLVGVGGEKMKPPEGKIIV